MTTLDRLADIVARMTPGPWIGDDKVGDIQVGPRIIATVGYQCEESIPNQQGIVALRNAAAELIEVARAAHKLHGGDRERDCNCDVCKLADALVALEVNLGGGGKTFKSKAPIWEPEY